MLNKKVCVGYVNNSGNRERTVARWQELYEAMPIGVPLTATEIAERANENHKGYPIYSHYNVTPMVKALGLEVIKREKIAIEPYEVEVGHYFYRGKVVAKKIIVSEKTMFTRLV